MEGCLETVAGTWSMEATCEAIGLRGFGADLGLRVAELGLCWPIPEALSNETGRSVGYWIETFQSQCFRVRLAHT